MKKGYEVAGTYRETASGLNDSRRELTKMFRQISSVNVVVIECNDRLARFGLNT